MSLDEKSLALSSLLPPSGIYRHCWGSCPSLLFSRLSNLGCLSHPLYVRCSSPLNIFVVPRWTSLSNSERTVLYWEPSTGPGTPGVPPVLSWEKGSLPQPASNALPNATQGAIGLHRGWERWWFKSLLIQSTDLNFSSTFPREVPWVLDYSERLREGGSLLNTVLLFECKTPYLCIPPCSSLTMSQSLNGLLNI